VIARPVDLEQSYHSAFAEYLEDPSEAALHAAYELGREALARELSILDLAALHHQALLSAMADADSEPVVEAARDFFLEALSAFEMLRRGFREAQEAALVEKRHGLILRQLSNFLADASIALGATESLGEVLQLVAEQARELTKAECSVARMSLESSKIEAVSHSETDARWQSFATETDLTALSVLLEPPRNGLRLGGEELAQHSRQVRNWLGAALVGWDGATLGSVHLFDKIDADFSETDEAVLVHLAQMAVTAVERARRSA
jgi:GAF domain-containing protein